MGAHRPAGVCAELTRRSSEGGICSPVHQKARVCRRGEELHLAIAFTRQRSRFLAQSSRESRPWYTWDAHGAWHVLWGCSQNTQFINELVTSCTRGARATLKVSFARQRTLLLTQPWRARDFIERIMGQSMLRFDTGGGASNGGGQGLRGCAQRKLGRG